MSKSRHAKKGRGKGGEKRGKQQERVVRQALRRERKAAGAYLSPGDPEFRSFSNQLAAQGLRLQDVPGDGLVGPSLWRRLVSGLC